MKPNVGYCIEELMSEGQTFSPSLVIALLDQNINRTSTVPNTVQEEQIVPSDDDHRGVRRGRKRLSVRERVKLLIL